MTEMSDLEITKACAEKMGLYPSQFGYGEPPFEQTLCGRGQGGTYDPLHDDAQCFALVKRFGLWVSDDGDNGARWIVSAKPHANDAIVENADLNRAICECVAKMK